jgi:hypothetical protein
MDPTLKWVALGAGLLVVLVIYAIVKAALGGRRRRDAIRQWAFRNGMSYLEGPVDPSNIAKIPQEEKNEKLISRNASNIVSGRRDHFDIAVFDLTETHSGVNRNSRTFTWKTVAVLKMPAELPYFRFSIVADLKPGSFGANMLGAVEKLAATVDAGKHGTLIPIPDHPGMVLMARDPDAALALFTRTVIDFFTRNTGYGVIAEGTALMVEKSTTRNLIDFEELEGFIAKSTSIAQQFHQGF